jgi:hypothetical protein
MRMSALVRLALVLVLVGLIWAVVMWAMATP